MRTRLPEEPPAGKRVTTMDDGGRLSCARRLPFPSGDRLVTRLLLSRRSAVALLFVVAVLSPGIALGQEEKVVPLPDPGTVLGYRGKINKVFYFEVTGATTGIVWGSGPYTDDSSLATASVHAGALKAGEVGVVKVT